VEAQVPAPKAPWLIRNYQAALKSLKEARNKPGADTAKIDEQIKTIEDSIGKSSNAFDLFNLHKAFCLQLNPGEVGEMYHCRAAAILESRVTVWLPALNEENIERITNSPASELASKNNDQAKQFGFLDPLEYASNINRSAKDPGSKLARGDINLTILIPLFQSAGIDYCRETILAGFLQGLDVGQINAINAKLIELLPNPGGGTADASRSSSNATVSTAIGPSNIPPIRAAIWIRNANKEVNKNISEGRIQELVDLMEQAGIEEILLLGDLPPETYKTPNTSLKVYNQLLSFWGQGWFKAICGKNTFACQVALLHLLYRYHGLTCLVGNRSGGMDGASLSGIPQLFLDSFDDETKDPNPAIAMTRRMGMMAQAVPFWFQVPMRTWATRPFTTKEQKRVLQGLANASSLKPSYCVNFENEALQSLFPAPPIFKNL
jgi:hypothetical protein